jgi:hypothetical protein
MESEGIGKSNLEEPHFKTLGRIQSAPQIRKQSAVTFQMSETCESKFRFFGLKEITKTVF